MDDKWILGVDIGGTSIKAGIVNNKGTVILQDIIPTQAQLGRDRVFGNVLGLLKGYIQYAKNKGIEIDGIGIGTAGQVNPFQGIVAGATDNLPGWQGIELRNEVACATGYSVFIDNDVNAIAIGESWIGAGTKYPNFLCIAIGTGIGGCFISGGKPYYGRDGFAGEYGHQVIDMNGLQCTCGNLGCWEQYASVTALMRLAHNVDERNPNRNKLFISPKHLFQEARNGVSQAKGILEQYTDYIAIGIANLVHLFNPPAILLNGAIAQQGDFFIQGIRSKVQTKLLPVYAKAKPILLIAGSLGEMAGVIGAAKLVIANKEIPSEADDIYSWVKKQ